MNNSRICAIWFAVLALGLSACAKPDEIDCKNPVAGYGDSRLITFGDSQTTGHGSETSKHCGYSWANEISVREGLTLENYAVGGTNFTDFAQSGRMLVVPYRATDRVMLLIGFNDMANFGDDPAHLALFRERLREALIHISPLVRSITIGTCLYPPVWLSPLSSEAAVLAYRTAVHEIVAELDLSNVVAAEVDGAFEGESSAYIIDHWHIGLEAQKSVANALLAAEVP